MADVSLITGASRGIGAAVARKLAEEGHDLMLFGRDSGALNKVKSECEAKGVNAEVFTGDVTEAEFVKDSIKKILKKYDHIDHLINNAGVLIINDFLSTSFLEFKKTMDVNLFGVYNFTREVLPQMITRKSGSVINISSLSGKNGFKGGTMYAASKHALMGFTRSLMQEVREHNIRVVAVCPGSVNTGMIKGTKIEPEDTSRILDPEDVAETVRMAINMPVRALVSELEVRPTNPR